MVRNGSTLHLSLIVLKPPQFMEVLAVSLNIEPDVALNP